MKFILYEYSFIIHMNLEVVGENHSYDNFSSGMCTHLCLYSTTLNSICTGTVPVEKILKLIPVKFFFLSYCSG